MSEQGAQLIAAVQELSHATDMPEIQRVVRTYARALASADGATFVLMDGDQCYYADEDAIEPLWKGQRFPLSACVSGWAMLNREAAVIPDIYADDRVPVEAYRPTFVRSLAMVPVRQADPIAAIGVYWAQMHEVSATELSSLQALADSTAVAMAHVQAIADLERTQSQRAQLAQRAEAAENRITELALEMARLDRSMDHALQLAGTDQLTGLPNRRGFTDKVAVARAFAKAGATTSVLMFFDLDGLKAVNDEFGHTAGDRLLRNAADLLGQTLRNADVLARWGGDEFVAFLSDGTHAERTSERIVAALETAHDAADPLSPRVSVGAAIVEPSDDRPVETLIAEADAAMYEHKAGRRTD